MSGVYCKRNPHVLSPLFISDESTSKTDKRTSISESTVASITALSISISISISISASASARNNIFLFLSFSLKLAFAGVV